MKKAKIAEVDAEIVKILDGLLDRKNMIARQYNVLLAAVRTIKSKGSPPSGSPFIQSHGWVTPEVRLQFRVFCESCKKEYAVRRASAKNGLSIFVYPHDCSKPLAEGELYSLYRQAWEHEYRCRMEMADPEATSE